MAIISGDTLIPQESLKGKWYYVPLIIAITVVIIIIISAWGPLNESLMACQKDPQSCGCNQNLSGDYCPNPDGNMPIIPLLVVLGITGILLLTVYIVMWIFYPEDSKT